eukprot:scaffold2772_cov16-Prasinocladus_malaysianus.AAC.1
MTRACIGCYNGDVTVSNRLCHVTTLQACLVVRWKAMAAVYAIRQEAGCIVYKNEGYQCKVTLPWCQVLYWANRHNLVTKVAI